MCSRGLAHAAATTVAPRAVVGWYMDRPLPQTCRPATAVLVNITSGLLRGKKEWHLIRYREVTPAHANIWWSVYVTLFSRTRLHIKQAGVVVSIDNAPDLYS